MRTRLLTLCALLAVGCYRSTIAVPCGAPDAGQSPDDAATPPTDALVVDWRGEYEGTTQHTARACDTGEPVPDRSFPTVLTVDGPDAAHPGIGMGGCHIPFALDGNGGATIPHAVCAGREYHRGIVRSDGVTMTIEADIRVTWETGLCEEVRLSFEGVRR